MVSNIIEGSLSSVCAFANFVILIIALNKIYSSVSEKSTVMTVFTILSFGLLIPIFLFAIRNNELIEDDKVESNNTAENNTVVEANNEVIK